MSEQMATLYNYLHAAVALGSAREAMRFDKTHGHLRCRYCDTHSEDGHHPECVYRRFRDAQLVFWNEHGGPDDNAARC